ncbi:MAG: crotonase/enoyl-CoA hydratase family protein [Alphaproteobacteria bacterium]
MSDAITLETDGPVATLTFNRPDARNALGAPGDGDLAAELCGRINANREIRCAILTGSGTAFSAGGNLKAMREQAGMFEGPGTAIADSYRTNVHRLVRAFWNLEVPLIAAVNGPAIGLGNDIACMADTRIAADTARFGATFLKIGLVPGDGGAWLLPRVIGMARAAELLYTGEIVGAETAREWGLVSRVVPAADLMAEARALAAKIAAQPPDVLRMTKRLLRESMRADFDTIMELSAASQALAHHTEDHREALDAFLNKRDPVFRGR